MKILLTYEEYKDGLGDILPKISEDDNQDQSVEEKYEKWLKICQVQLNYAIGDKLAEVDYDREVIVPRYLSDIQNILAVRLNRAFYNDQIIPRDVNVNYQTAGGINVSISSDNLNEGWDFWSAQERKLIDASGLRRVPKICFSAKLPKNGNGNGKSFTCEEIRGCPKEVIETVATQVESESLKFEQDKENDKLKIEVKDGQFIKADLSNFNYKNVKSDTTQGNSYQLIKTDNNLVLRRAHLIPFESDKNAEKDNQLPNLKQVNDLISASGGKNFKCTDLEGCIDQIETIVGKNFLKRNWSNRTGFLYRDFNQTGDGPYKLDIHQEKLSLIRNTLTPLIYDGDMPQKDNELPNISQVRELIAQSGGSLKCEDLKNCRNQIKEIIKDDFVKVDLSNFAIGYAEDRDLNNFSQPTFILNIEPVLKELQLKRRIKIPFAYEGRDITDVEGTYIPNYNQIKKMIETAGVGGYFTKEQADNVKNTVLYLPDSTPANNKPYIVADDLGYAMEGIYPSNIFKQFLQIYQKFNLEITGTLERFNFVENYRAKIDNSVLKIEILNKDYEIYEYGENLTGQVTFDWLSSLQPTSGDLFERVWKINGSTGISEPWQRITFNIIKGVGLKISDWPKNMILKSKEKNGK